MSLGDTELKFVSLGDFLEFSKILQMQLSDRDAVAQILFHQLVKPQINFDDFRKVSDNEPEGLARDFVKSEPQLFKQFQGTGDFLEILRKCLQVALSKRILMN